LFERGYSVACVDLPGQGALPDSDLHWEIAAEKPIKAVVDTLIEQFGARSKEIALLGLSLGGYFVTRAAGHEKRLASVIASTPFPMPGHLFAQSIQAAMAKVEQGAVSEAAKRNWQMLMWKAGVRTPQALMERTALMVADPSIVTVPFLSIVGGGDSPIFQAQAESWHQSIRSARKDLVLLDARTGADGHCQVNARSRLTQETLGWLSDIFAC
jgi:esterase/lipase